MGRKNKCAKKLNQRSRKLARDSAKTKKTNVTNKQAATEATNQIQDTAVEINTANQDTVVETNTANQDKAVETDARSQDVHDERTEDPVINVPAKAKTLLEIATEASEAAFDPSNRIFFTYGASVLEKRTRLRLGKESSNNHELKRLAGAAAIYKQLSADNTKGSWRGKQWTLGHCETTSEADAELVAISECLSIAAKEFRHAKDQKTAPKITIITHDQDATDTFGRVCYIDPTKDLPEATPALLEIVKQTHSLRQSVGAVIELHCVPQHAVELKLCCNSRPMTVKGTKLAEFAARKPTTTKTLKVPSSSYRSD